MLPDNPSPPSTWTDHADGSRSRVINGIRIVDRTRARASPGLAAGVEHLVTWQEAGGRVAVLGLDARCRPVAVSTLYHYE